MSSPRYVIRANGYFRTRWDILIIIISLWVCFTLPVQLAFEPDFLDSSGNLIFNDMIDVLYGLDILLNFRTSYINTMTGDEVIDPKMVALAYLKGGRFFIDLLATIPFDSILGNSDGSKVSIKLRIFTILKILRIVRFTKVIAFLNTTASVKLSLKLFKLIFYLLVYIHLQACAWFFYTKQDRTWYPIPDLIKNEFHFYDQGFYYTYCLSLYHSVSILDGAEMVPATGH